MTGWSENTVRANNITIHYNRTSITGDASKPSMLLLHGVTDNGLCWTRVARHLEDSYDVIMPDARGHGHSDGIATGFSVAILAEDVAQLIQALKLNRPYLYGHSMGAITAAAVAATYPDLVRAVILEDPPLIDRLSSDWSWVAQLKALTWEERVAHCSAENPGWVREEITNWADSKGEVQLDVTQHIDTLDSAPWREFMKRIQCPILLITADTQKGALVTPETARAAVQLWKQGEVRYIMGAGHSIHRDRFDETMATVDNFLQRT